MAKRRKKKRRILSNILTFIVLLFGIALIFNQQIKNFLIGLMTKNSLDDLTVETVQKNMEADASFDFDAVNSLDFDTVMQANFADNLLTIGAIAIPDVELNLPIFKGVTDYSLAAGAGTLRADQVMGEGNYPLASHHLDNENLLFSPLFRATEGMTIYITDLADIYEYEIDHIESIAPSRVDVIEDIEDKTMITLITCTDNGVNRLLVQGTFIGKTSSADATEEMKQAFENEQRTWFNQ